MNAPVVPPKDAEAIHDLQWWIAERERVGTDWHSLLLNTVRALGLVTPCPTSGCEPCPLPSFCQSCREADAKAAKHHDDPHLKRLRRLMDDDIGLERASVEVMKGRPTPNATIEAIKQSVRDRGVTALKEAANRERLSQCDNAARAEIDRWVARLERAGR
jgi:hypothetical protein